MDGASILPEPTWYVAIAVPAREYRARDWAVQRGFTAWLPECEIKKTTRTKVMLTTRMALFPGYLFVQLDDAHPWRVLDEASAIHDLLKFGGEPAVLPAHAVARLRHLLANGPLEIDDNCRRRFAENQPIRLIGGMWDGWEGLYVSRVKDRIKILLDIFGRQTETLVPEALVEPA